MGIPGGGSVPDRGNWEGKVLGIGTTRRPDWLESGVLKSRSWPPS